MLTPSNGVKATPPATNPSEFDRQNIRHAIFQAEQGLKEAGVPIGAALVRNDGVVIGVGRNRRVQQNSPCRHGEVRSPSWRQAVLKCAYALHYAPDGLPRGDRPATGQRLQGLHVSREEKLVAFLFLLCSKDTDSLTMLCSQHVHVRHRPRAHHELFWRRLKASFLRSTLSPCTMCTGAMILFGIKRCVMGENDTFVGKRAKQDP